MMLASLSDGLGMISGDVGMTFHLSGRIFSCFWDDSAWFGDHFSMNLGGVLTILE